MRLFVALLLLLGFVGLGMAAGGERSPPIPSDWNPSDTLTSLERTPCFGMCPSYRVEVFRDGRVVYEGRRFVEVEGPVEDTLEASTLARLQATFEEAEYFAFRNRYTSGSACESVVTDLPTVTTSYHTEKASKEVVHYHGCLGFEGKERLRALEDSIDAIVGTDRWIGDL